MCKTIENWIPTDQPPWNCKNTLSLIQARSFLRICMNGYCSLGGNTHSNTMSDHGVIVILSDMNRRTTLKSLMVVLNLRNAMWLRRAALSLCLFCFVQTI